MSTAIDVNNLSVRFSGHGGFVEALRGISMSVNEGEVFGFLGPNGSGKTTTMLVLLGFIEPGSGHALIFGEDVRKRIARERIGYLPEKAETYSFLTGRELLVMAGRLFGMRWSPLEKRIEEILDQVRLMNAADRRIATYSRGMLQRIGLAQALINDPDLLILDEPTGGMDPLGRMEIRKIIAGLRDRGKTVFFSSHELSEVELVCDHIAIIADGRIVVRGAVSELIPEAESLEQYFLKVMTDSGIRAGGAL
ncbi:MAG: ABC transporter ATP-binding protein [Candidatus Aureabacteria bacterium]|nr:ABC transporter ATP-binding protein [Candidatus Auribacterota bacterium]